MSALYLYALASAEPAGAPGLGVAGEPLAALRCGGIHALVGEVAAPPRPARQALAAHDAAVRRLAELTPALLPARFGQTVPDAATLERLLAPRRAAFEEALELVAGCAQMTLRVFGAALPPGEPPAAPAAAGPGARYLAARRQALERSRALPEIADLRRELAPLLRAERIERHAAGELLATARDLVRREDAEAYLRIVAASAGRLGGRRAVASGPWPPYAFAPELAP